MDSGKRIPHIQSSIAISLVLQNCLVNPATTLLLAPCFAKFMLVCNRAQAPAVNFLSPMHKRNSVMQIPTACNSNSDRRKRQSRACPHQCFDNKTGWWPCSPVMQRIGRSCRCIMSSAMQAWPLPPISALVFVADHAQRFCLPQIIRQYSCCSSTSGFSYDAMKHVVHYAA